jgi:DNA-binding NarL/FixJ family response regulator
MSSTPQTADGGPFPGSVLAAVADSHDLDESALAEAVETVHESMGDGADAILQHYRSTATTPPTTARDGLVAVIRVPQTTWETVGPDLSDEVRTAVRAAHAVFADRLGVDSPDDDSTVPLVTPSATVGRLVRAGLSRRQAEVQVLRDAGLTQAEIGDRLGIATNTVKVHCHRIDTKVENARLLVASVSD